ncbi:MAG: PEP-CTERM sorting domain-containing protein, partial [Rhodocyclaceae bacterium]|nr:PEP-CTERM sorting domain-containing protein [Rhodocyclaceae bacterium]
SYATGGAGGTGAAKGSASATAIAASTAINGNSQAYSSANGSSANALAQSSGVGHGTIHSTATANGASGQAVALSTASSGSGQSVSASATTPVGSTANSQTYANFGGSYWGLPGASAQTNGETFSYVNGSPSAATVSGLLSGHAAVSSGLAGSTVIGSGVMGATYGNDSAAGTTHVFSASATFDYDYTGQHSVSLGFLGSNAFGGGFDSLNFTVSNNASVLYSHTFATLVEASSFFNNTTLNLGSFAGGMHLVINYDLTASAPKGMNFSYVVATAPVPEPETWALLLAGLGVMGAVRRRMAARQAV